MLIVNRAEGTFTDHLFREFPAQVRFGDCLVLNDTRVFPSRLIGHREGTGGEVEVFLTEQLNSSTWNTLVRPAKRVRVGDHIIFSDELRAEVLERGEFGERVVRLDAKRDLFDVLERTGHVPLPPYIHREDTEADQERYQTVFARERGSVAAPTAGLHFTPEILDRCGQAGAKVAHVTLHVGLGTFAPLRTEVIEDVRLHHETLHVSNATYEAMDTAKRVIAVGTTSVRAIESPRGATETDLFISPGFSFQRTGAMLTNFHLPKSSLLVLVSAFAGRELILAAYNHAVQQRYRFFSYGDCMLIV